MTEAELRQKVLEQAERWLGCNEWTGSHRAIIDEYNKISPLPRGYRMQYSDPWCAAFVSAVGRACGLEDILFPECACDPMIAKYQAAGRWMENDAYTPKPGDVVFYDWQDNGVGDNKGSSDHVGLVYSVYRNEMTIIEGNCSDMVAYTERKVNGRYIRGFGLPDYAGKAEETEGADRHDQSSDWSRDDTGGEIVVNDAPLGGEIVVIDAPLSHPEADSSLEGGATCEPELPVLRRGDAGEAVRAAQLLLIGRGISCGPDGADGDFGPRTEAAVRRYQASRGLTVDGVVGPRTWRALVEGR